MNPEPCGVDSCPAFAANAEGFCQTHAGAKRAGHVMTGTRCHNCNRVIETGDWVTRDSTSVDMLHVVCPPTRPSPGLKKDRPKPLLEAVDAQEL